MSGADTLVASLLADHAVSRALQIMSDDEIVELFTFVEEQAARLRRLVPAGWEVVS